MEFGVSTIVVSKLNLAIMMCSPNKNQEYGKIKHHYLKYCE